MCFSSCQMSSPVHVCTHKTSIFTNIALYMYNYKQISVIWGVICMLEPMSIVFSHISRGGSPQICENDFPPPRLCYECSLKFE